jgi:DNA-binding transcriptional LysR family regulator
MRAAGLSGAPPVVRHSFNDASLCLDAAIAGQGVMLAWQTLAGFSLREGRLVAPFCIRANTGDGYYFVTPEGGREPKKVRDFKAWIREEMAETAALFE